MAWTSPRTWVTSEVVTATIMNAHVRDNLNETAPAKASAKGDIFAATAANAISRVAIGSNGRTLIPNSGCNTGLEWTAVLQTTTTSGCQRTSVFPDIGGVIYSGTDPAAASTLAHVIFAASGTGGWLRFVETSVANRWMVGTLGGQDELNFAVGYAGASTLNMSLDSSGHLFLNSGGSRPVYDGIAGLEISTNGDAATILMRRAGVTNQTILGGDYLTAASDGYGEFKTVTNTAGGMTVAGLSSCQIGLRLYGQAGSANTVKSVLAAGAVEIEAGTYAYNGVAGGYYTYPQTNANANLVVIRTGIHSATSGSTQFIFDAEGDLHANAAVSGSAYDEWEDAHLARAVMTEIGGKHIIRDEFDQWAKYNREHVEKLGIVSFEDGGVMVNWTQLTRVLAGAAWQLAACQMRLERDIETRVAELTDRLDGMTRVLGAGSASGLQEWGAAT